MNDLPKNKFEEKKEDKKKGFLPWLRQKLGINPASATGGSGSGSGSGAGAANIGKAFGAAKIGGSSGFLGGILAGKGAMIATAAIVAVGLGGSVYLSNQPSDKAQSAFDSVQSGDSSYIPSGLRQKHQGSSLDMFRDTNKGNLFNEEAAAAKAEAKAKAEEEAGAKAKAEEDAKENADEDEQQVPDPNQMAAKLASGGMGDLSSSMGGGSNKLSSMGGFGNKFKSKGLSSNIGSGFQAMPKFNERKKMLAMKRQKRAISNKIKGKNSNKYGKKAYNQAKGVRGAQKSYSGTSIDSLKGSQDKAWEGTTDTGMGTSTGGGGLSEGGAGVVGSVPSTADSDTSGNGTFQEPDYTEDGDVVANTDDVVAEYDDSPWKSLADKAMTYILISAALALAGSLLIKASLLTMLAPPLALALRIAGTALCAVAALYAGLAIVNGFRIASTYGHVGLGAMYMIGGGIALAGAAAGVFGFSIGPITPLWMIGITALFGVAGAMLNGPSSASDVIDKASDKSFIKDVVSDGGDKVAGDERAYYGGAETETQDLGTYPDGSVSGDSGVVYDSDAAESQGQNFTPADNNNLVLQDGSDNPYYNPADQMNSRTLTYEELHPSEAEKLEPGDKAKEVSKGLIYKVVKPFVEIETAVDKVSESTVKATSDATDNTKNTVGEVVTGVSEGLTEGYDEAVEDGRK